MPKKPTLLNIPVPILAFGRLFNVGLSDELKWVRLTGKCPRCKAQLRNAIGLFTMNFYATDGTRLSPWLRHSLPALADTMECPNCSYRWKLGASPDTQPSTIEVLEIFETHRSEEFFGEDRRVIDNSKSSTQLTRNFSVSKEWSKSYQLDFERTQSDGAELTIGAKEVSGLKVSSEEKLRRTYSMSQGTSETCTEEVSCEVPAHKKVTIAVRWKRIWQHGFVRATRNGTPLQIPFRVAVGVNFDQQQTDGE